MIARLAFLALVPSIALAAIDPAREIPPEEIASAPRVETGPTGFAGDLAVDLCLPERADGTLDPDARVDAEY
jgi:hypothetical protein